MASHLSVGMLLPADISAVVAYRDSLIDRAERDEDAELGGNLRADTPIRFNGLAERLVDEFREMIMEVAGNVGVRVHVQDYQVHELAGHCEMMGSKRRRDFLKNDLLAAFDPSPTQCAVMMEGTVHNPAQRLAIAFSDPEDLYGIGRFLTAKKLPLFHMPEGEKYDVIQRAFPLHLSPNEDQRSQNFQHSKFMVAKAVCYPATPPQTHSKHSQCFVDQAHFTKLFVPKDV